MADRKGKEQGTRSNVSLRVGIDTPYLRGINRDYDAGSIAQNEHQDAENVRLVGGRIDNRGGQQKLNDVAMDGCIWSLDDLPMPVVGLFLTPFYNGQQSLDRYNTDLDPEYATVFRNTDLSISDPIYPHSQFINTAKPRQTLFEWRKRLFVCSREIISEVVFPKDNTDGDVSLRRLISIGAGLNQISSMAVVPEAGEEILYIGTLSNQELYRYDGTWLSTDGAIGQNASRMIVGRWHDRLYIFGTQYAMVRNPGPPLVNGIPAPGTYTTLAMAAGVTTFQPSRLIEWKDTLFIVGKDTAVAPVPGSPGPGCILAWDGSTMTLAHQPENNSNAPYTPAVGISDGIVFNGKFWFVWRDTDNVTLIGNYDGATWNDEVASLGPSETLSDCGDFVLANGLIYVTTIRGMASPGPGLADSQVVYSSSDGAGWTLVKNITLLDADAQASQGPPNIVAFA